MAGSNDLFGYGPFTATVLENYLAILNAVRSSCPQTKIYFQSILPVSSEQSKAIDLHLVNAALASLADGREVMFVDLHSEFELNGFLRPEFTLDGVHLNGDGYLIWRDAIASFI